MSLLFDHIVFLVLDSIITCFVLQVVLQYMVDYPLGKKLLRYVQFFLKQLDYDKESGRLSAIEFLVSLFNTFPKNFLSQQSTLFLVTMSPYLINETSASCVKAMAAAIRILIERLNTPTATTLFEVLAYLHSLVFYIVAFAY